MSGIIKPPRPRPRKPTYCKTCAKIYLAHKKLPSVAIAETYKTRIGHLCLPAAHWRALCGVDTRNHKWRAVGTRVVTREELEA